MHMLQVSYHCLAFKSSLPANEIPLLGPTKVSAVKCGWQLNCSMKRQQEKKKIYTTKVLKEEKVLL